MFHLNVIDNKKSLWLRLHLQLLYQTHGKNKIDWVHQSGSHQHHNLVNKFPASKNNISTKHNKYKDHKQDNLISKFKEKISNK